MPSQLLFLQLYYIITRKIRKITFASHLAHILIIFEIVDLTAYVNLMDAQTNENKNE